MTRLYIVLGVVIVLLMARLLSSQGGVSELFALQGQLKTLQLELSEQQKLNAHLEQQVLELRTQDSAVETLARQTLGMIEKDEVFIEVIELKSSPGNFAGSVGRSTDTEVGQVLIKTDSES